MKKKKSEAARWEDKGLVEVGTSGILSTLFVRESRKLLMLSARTKSSASEDEGTHKSSARCRITNSSRALKRRQLQSINKQCLIKLRFCVMHDICSFKDDKKKIDIEHW